MGPAELAASGESGAALSDRREVARPWRDGKNGR